MAPRQPPTWTPDLFSTRQMAGAPKPAAAPTRQDAADQAAAPTRYVLPQGLALALRTMEDAEFDRLLAAVVSEARRRGRLPMAPMNEKLAIEGHARPKAAGVDSIGPGSLTTGQTNAVRAAFKAGVKLSAIARQFGLSPAQVKRALG